MPADNQQLGETWELQDLNTGQSTQAVITEVFENRVDLIGRLGRNIVIPQSTLMSTWRFVAEAPNQTCAFESCDSLAFLQIENMGGWVWVCRQHLPARRQPLLPSDTPEDRGSRPGGLNRCPACGAAIRDHARTEPSGTALDVWRCGRCAHWWVILLGTTEDDNGHSLAEAIPEAAHYLEMQGLAAEANVGSVALTDIRRAVDLSGSIEHELRLMGVPLTRDDRFGPNTVLVIGERPRTGVQRLGGRPDQAAVHGPPGRRRHLILGPPDTFPVEPPPEVAPIAAHESEWPNVGSLWQARTTGAIVQVDGIQDRLTPLGRTVRVSYRHTADTPMEELSVDEFLCFFAPAPEPGEETPDFCEVGDEFIDTKENVVVIDELNDNAAFVHVKGNPQSKHLIPLHSLRQMYRKLNRQSAFERLLEDDEL